MSGACRRSRCPVVLRKADCRSGCRSLGHTGKKTSYCGSLSHTNRRRSGTSAGRSFLSFRNKSVVCLISGRARAVPGGQPRAVPAFFATPSISIRLIHRSNIVRQRQDERAFSCRCRAGEISPAKNFHRGVVGESDVVVGVAQRLGEALQLFVAADELHAFDCGLGAASVAEQNEELRVASLFGFAEMDDTQILEAEYGCSGWRSAILTRECSEPFTRFRNGAQTLQR